MIPLLVVTVEVKNLDRRTPLLYFFPPLAQSDFGYNDQMVGCSVGNFFLRLQFLDQGKDSDGLDGLAQSHFVSKDAV